MLAPGIQTVRQLGCYRLLSLLVLAGCTHWRPARESPADLLAPEPPPRVRITRLDESRVELRRPQLVGDTLIDGRTRDGSDVKVPLAQVAQVAVRKWDPIGTAGVVLGTAALGAIVTIGLMWDARD
jgi:hypothetical protein